MSSWLIEMQNNNSLGPIQYVFCVQKVQDNEAQLLFFFSISQTGYMPAVQVEQRQCTPTHYGPLTSIHTLVYMQCMYQLSYRDDHTDYYVAVNYSTLFRFIWLNSISSPSEVKKK